ncbi:hypothetical protein ACFOGJ_15925 [Marinibaculum pumilum]|uniref:Uncharacterized protein n=1 Tax=Marinibaculum pumilum TaxID=1766165 RepID=A0ABV7L2U8_9PROT
MTLPAHGPKPLGLRRSKRRWAFSLTRFGAVTLFALVLVHLAFLYVVADQSPAWAHGMRAVQDLLLADAGARGLAGWLFVILALLCAVALWSAASRAAALLFFGVSLWDAWWRIWELEQRAQSGLGYEFLPYFGALVAFIALFASVLALIGSLFADRSGGSRIDGSLID